jgi:hypothetical protein
VKMHPITVILSLVCGVLLGLLVLAVNSHAATHPSCGTVATQVRALPGYRHVAPMACKYLHTRQGIQQFRIAGIRPGHRYVGLINMYHYECDMGVGRVCWIAEIVAFVGKRT